jgi:excinuclease ABC subunit B
MSSEPSEFHLEAPFPPAGDQPKAIESIVDSFSKGQPFQTLLGVTGSGKTYTMANVIQKLGKPTLILSHNKTLVAQLYQEFKAFFPKNAVEYFVSYYDYYQPEAYIPTSDTYIEKDSSINDEIEKLRLRTTASLMTRKDVIVVASVSCIYGLGSPTEYQALMLSIEQGEEKDRDEILRQLVDIHYARNDIEFKRGTFRVRGDVVEVRPAYDDFAIRIELFGNEVEKMSRVDIVTGEELAVLPKVLIYPARHYVTQEETMGRVIKDIKLELKEQLQKLRKEDRLVEAQRLESRVQYDMEMLEETGFCTGIENYSRIIEDREIGTPPNTLIDFFGEDYLLIVDESHASIPQVGAMYGGDRSRKENLVKFGFRLPCALDNRPLNFQEFEERLPDNTLFVSATPGEYELKQSEGLVVEQIVRPTGLLDPKIEIFPIKGQIDHLLEAIRQRVEKKERILVLTLTKKSAEDLADFLESANLKVLYMHSDTDTLKRTEILHQLREGQIDVLVGINLLREGLDLPEVSLVAILDADKEGFLRNRRTLIQIAGRAARNVNGQVYMYADRITDSMRATIDETQRRRQVQEAFNQEHDIEPQTVQRAIRDSVELLPDSAEDIQKKEEYSLEEELLDVAEPGSVYERAEEKDITVLEQAMLAAAENLEFEKAAALRDKIQKLKEL